MQNMTTGSEGVEFFLDANIGGDRALPSEGHRTCGIPNFANNGYVFKDMSCLDCRHALPLSAEAWAKLVRIVESVAAGTDHIRIDVFVTVDGEPLVNEANSRVHMCVCVALGPRSKRSRHVHSTRALCRRGQVHCVSILRALSRRERSLPAAARRSPEHRSAAPLLR